MVVGGGSVSFAGNVKRGIVQRAKDWRKWGLPRCLA